MREAEGSVTMLSASIEPAPSTCAGVLPSVRWQMTVVVGYSSHVDALRALRAILDEFDAPARSAEQMLLRPTEGGGWEPAKEHPSHPAEPAAAGDDELRDETSYSPNDRAPEQPPAAPVTAAAGDDELLDETSYSPNDRAPEQPRAAEPPSAPVPESAPNVQAKPRSRRKSQAPTVTQGAMLPLVAEPAPVAAPQPPAVAPVAVSDVAPAPQPSAGAGEAEKPAKRTRRAAEPKPELPPSRELVIGLVPATMPVEDRKQMFPETPASNPFETKFNGVDVPDAIRHCTSFEKLFAFCVSNTPEAVSAPLPVFTRGMLALRNCVAYLATLHDQEVIARTEKLFVSHWWQNHATELDASPLPKNVLDLFVEARTIQDAVLIGVQAFNTSNPTVLADALIECGKACPAVFGAIAQMKSRGLKPDDVRKKLIERVDTCFAEATSMLEERGLWGESGYVAPVQR